MSAVQQSRKSRVASVPAIALRYPLTVKALELAFEALSPDGIELSKQSKYQEAAVDGAWSLTKLTLHFRNLGFKPAGPQHMLAFVNSDETVGLVLYGVEPHRTKNTWKTYCIEVQARPLAVAQAWLATRSAPLANLLAL